MIILECLEESISSEGWDDGIVLLLLQDFIEDRCLEEELEEYLETRKYIKDQIEGRG